MTEVDWHFGPQLALWPWIVGLVSLQGALVSVLLRLRDPKRVQGLFLAEKSNLAELLA
jgi:hypothetical protein